MNYLIIHKFILILTFLSISNIIYSQKIRVIDDLNGNTLSNVIAFNYEQKIYSLSDKNGELDISDFKKDEIIFFQLLGYKEISLRKSEIINNGLLVELQYEKNELEEVILSVARKSSSKKKIAKKVSIITADQIEFNMSSTGAELLNISPGIRVQKSQGGGGSPVIRGFEANRVLLVIDGVRMNNAIYRSGHLHNSITVDPHNIDRVEIIYGPSSVGYGSDALGGVIHFYTKTPEINIEKKIKTTFSSKFSSSDLSLINNITSTYSSKKWASITSISSSKFNDILTGKKRFHGFKSWGLNNYYYPSNSNVYYINPIKNPNPNIQKNTGYSQYDVFQKFAILLPQQFKLNLNLQFSNSSNISRYDKLTEKNSSGKLKYSEWYYGPQKRLFFAPQLKFYPGKKLIKKGTLTPAIQFIKESRINRRSNALNKSIQKESLVVYSLNGDFEGSMTPKLSFSYGFEVVQNKLSSTAYSEKLILLNNKIIGFENRILIPTRYPSGGSSYKNYASYINFDFDINKSTTINYGLRFTWSSIEANWQELASIDAFLSNYKSNSNALTTSLGIAHRTNNNLKFNAIFSSGFRNPNIDDIGKIRENNGILTVPNTFLKPEYAYNFDLGLDYFSPKIKNTISFRTFISLISRHIVRSNYTIFADKSTKNPNTILYDGNEVITIANKNLGNRVIYGGSLDTKISINKTLKFISNFTLTKADSNIKYGPMPSISPFFGAIIFNYSKKNFSVETKIKFSESKRPDEFSKGGEDRLESTPLIKSSILNGEKINYYYGFPSWNTFSIISNYMINESFIINLGINNIFDANYREFSSGISSPGRNFIAGIRFDF